MNTLTPNERGELMMALGMRSRELTEQIERTSNLNVPVSLEYWQDCLDNINSLSVKLLGH